MTLDDALEHTRTWLSHHYEIISESRGQHSAIVSARHLGNTPGTAKIQGQPQYILVETHASLEHRFPERQVALAAKVGTFSLVLPASKMHSAPIDHRNLGVIHSYGDRFT